MTSCLVSVYKKNGLPPFRRFIHYVDLYAPIICLQTFVLVSSLFHVSSKIQKINSDSKIRDDKKLLAM